MDAQEASKALAAEGLSFTSVELVSEQGWASWTFELDGSMIVRFPRNDEIVEAMHREMRLLPALARHVSFRVPEPLVMADDWFVYEKIPGRPFTVGDDVEAAIAMIEELQSFPVDEARRLLQRRSWTEARAQNLDLFRDVAFPHLPPDLVERIERVYDMPPPARETLIHDDLGLEHLLVDERGRPVGIIDFEDATVGDPEVDLVPLAHTVGLPITERMWRYRWNGSLHAIVHHVWEDELDEVPAVVEELRRRLDAAEGR